jgi:hypothetical protein
MYQPSSYNCKKVDLFVVRQNQKHRLIHRQG